MLIHVQRHTSSPKSSTANTCRVIWGYNTGACLVSPPHQDSGWHQGHLFSCLHMCPVPCAFPSPNLRLDNQPGHVYSLALSCCGEKEGAITFSSAKYPLLLALIAPLLAVCASGVGTPKPELLLSWL